ncbi:hypothetical protein SS50377_27985 [Spironucleus salmonicida]|uniref:Uncharacterized protein n=1 Tax=Spironucleus salmonicida TaxID=348837 RepID=V6LDI2_9EUKA|nr:hypothetical protein SS50377_27985 [Spironucleus salmonicida]|eukprot:EST42542.1 Hypothetical protein SS50377_17856 [Spironucleus salmonicida]
MKKLVKGGPSHKRLKQYQEPDVLRHKESLRILLNKPRVFDNMDFLSNSFSNSQSGADFVSSRKPFAIVNVQNVVKVSNLQHMVVDQEYAITPFKKQAMFTVEEEINHWKENLRDTIDFALVSKDIKDQHLLNQIFLLIHESTRLLGRVEYLNQEINVINISTNMLLKKLQQINLRKLI